MGAQLNTESSTDGIVSKTLDRIITKNQQEPWKDLLQGSIINTDTPPIMVVQYRGTENLIFANKVRNVIKVPIVFNVRVLETCLPSSCLLFPVKKIIIDLQVFMF